MKAHPRSGRLVQQIDGYRAFEPSPLPPQPPVAYEQVLVARLSAADTAIGRLDGLARVLPDADLFLAMYVRHEALLSSRIEGTDCSLDDVLAFELDEAAPVPELDVREVVNYVGALSRGIELLGELPLCNRLLREVHGTLLRSGRGSDKTPGEFRRTQNWIGPQGCSLAGATYVPPPPLVMEQAMTDLESFLHEITHPVLITVGLAHAQFETIHPFLDGNGRTGRLLVSLLLHERNELQKPVLHISAYLNRRRTTYFDHLMTVREDGDWEGWLTFFLEAVRDAADDAARTASAIHLLRETDRARLSARGGAQNDLRLLDALYGQPLVNAGWVGRTLDVAPTTAIRLLDRAVDAGVLRETTGQRRNRVYRYDRYISLFETETGPIASDRTVD